MALPMLKPPRALSNVQTIGVDEIGIKTFYKKGFNHRFFGLRY
jgi:hypothetical protein